MLEPTIVYVVVVFFIATIVRSTIGFGEALVAVPLLALRIPVAVATPCVVAISVIVAGVNLLIDWRHVEIRSATGLVLSSLIGLPIGIFVLRLLDDRIVKLLLGVMIVGISMYSLTRRSAAVPSLTDRKRWLIVAGMVSGVLGGAYGMNGPPLAIYGTLRGWSPNRFRATLQGYFLVASVAGLIGYGVAGVWTSDASRYLLVSLPCVLGAILVARMFNKRTDDVRFFRVVYCGMTVIGTVLFVQALRR
jgi:uncharacterized membrane protein YfcA